MGSATGFWTAERAALMVSEDLLLDLPLNPHCKELKFHKLYRLVFIDSIAEEIMWEWLSGSSGKLIRDNNATSIGVGISAGKGFFVNALIVVQ